MKTVKTMQFWVSLLTIQAFLLNPLVTPRAAANPVDDFHKTCDQVYKPSDSKSPSATGLQTRGECDKAKMAVVARKVETTKVLLLGTAAAICTTLALVEDIPISAGAAKTTCKALSMGTSFASSQLDKSGVTQNKEIVGSFAASASSAIAMVGTVWPMLKTIGVGGDLFDELTQKTTARFAKKAGTHAVKKEAERLAEKGAEKGVEKGVEEQARQKIAEKKMACLSSAIMLGIQTGISAAGLIAADKSLRITVAEAKTAIDLAAAGGAQTLHFQNTNREVANAPNAEVVSGDLDSVCSRKSGNEHLKCVAEGSNSAELTALTNNQPFLDHLQKALGGKSPGDFAKDFKGETKQDAANYIANGLGMGPNGGEAMAKLMDAQSKLAHDTGAADKYDPMNYARTGSAPTIKGDDNQDFAKMMGDMMNKLNPDGSPANGKDPSELVFRQLDLLSPEKIEQNKEISLFARIGYRYRKKASDVEQLNWASEQNRAVASDPSAQKKQ